MSAAGVDSGTGEARAQGLPGAIHLRAANTEIVTRVRIGVVQVKDGGGIVVPHYTGLITTKLSAFSANDDGCGRGHAEYVRHARGIVESDGVRRADSYVEIVIDQSLYAVPVRIGLDLPGRNEVKFTMVTHVTGMKELVRE